jgi:hypothetical protein
LFFAFSPSLALTHIQKSFGGRWLTSWAGNLKLKFHRQLLLFGLSSLFKPDNPGTTQGIANQEAGKSILDSDHYFRDT